MISKTKYIHLGPCARSGSNKNCPKFVKSCAISPVSLPTCPKPYQCKWIDCKSSGFDSQIGLVTHIERVHVESRREDFSCFWLGCPRRNRPFNARYKLLIHLRIHSGHKPNKCTFQDCDKAFSRLENLKIHLRSHTGERPYICTNATCFKSFSNSSDRAKHQRTHIDKKPYACTFPNCGKRYTDPSSLRKHAKIHTEGNGEFSPTARPKKTNRTTKTANVMFTGLSSSQMSYSSPSSAILTPSPTPSVFGSEKSFDFPDPQFGHQFETVANPVSDQPVQNYLFNEYSQSPVVKSEYYFPDLNCYYSSDFDWMLYFELRDVETILGNGDCI